MDPIGAIRPYPPPVDLTALSSAGTAKSSGPGGISTEQFEALAAAIQAPTSADAAGSNQASFANLLGQMARDVQAKQAAADTAMTGLLSGQGVPLHEAVMKSEEASLSFQLMVEIRNKLLESYQELMRMQV